MFYFEEVLKALLCRYIKIGEVSSVDYSKATARVAFDDDDSVVSYDLPVLQTNTYANKDYAMPDIGEDVLCLFLPSGPEEGFILGSFYAEEIEPVENNPDIRSVVFSDDTRVSYDRKTHQLRVTINETEIIANQQNIAIKTPNNVDVTCTTATVSASSNVTIDTPKTDVTGVLNVTGLITGKGGLSVSGGNGGASISCAGDMDLKGTIAASGDVTAGGISLQGHTHPGDSGGTTGSPQ